MSVAITALSQLVHNKWLINDSVSIGASRWHSGKEFAYNTGDAGDSGLIPGSGRSLEEEMATQSSVLAWKIL